MYSYYPNRQVSLWLGCLTTTPHYWPLHYTTLWCGWTTMSNKKKRSCLRTKTLLLKDWIKSCVSSVANWCSNKYKRASSEYLNDSGGAWGVTGDFSFSFLPCRWQVGAYGEQTCRKRGSSPFSVSLMDPSFCSRCHSPRIWISLQLCYFFKQFSCVCGLFLFWLPSQSCICGEKNIKKEKKKEKKKKKKKKGPALKIGSL